mmetsp:Transcript_92139/g.192644  ORF Transcript_92139/g.192644 Transcript_92139/m.192644 type:complete len:300 (-) Transcript_92139:308-1207(-)|eukprot:CAMPEP_0206505552 /NCGR_PEP_ID=MMETSP0324_2-20121206/56205_1 /ASSEMBLY_ACC=CAM_ASM_000836 /TAXON_ID=2866 /ORGANISM="Crypthecodinium cohnii, Strain Seligo" /LENGTH=299 /DNA_ID=CAMNT_0053995047 /DNA_START=266 /DNA_END=1165 /DNA_ORIENTATION=-
MNVLKLRLNIDPEFQGWVLVFATVTAIWIFCLPCYCAGLSWVAARRFASRLHLPTFYAVAGVINVAFIGLVLLWLPDWDLNSYIQSLVKCTIGTLQRVLSCASSLTIVFAFAFAVAFKDRIAKLLGMDHKTLFRCKLRDFTTCFGPSRFQPIELTVWKVDDLPSADPFAANNVFIEFYLGYNEPMRTRVHNNAGSGCTIKESMQLNFDEDDLDETLYIFVKDQKVVGTLELARAEIPTDQLRKMVAKSRHFGYAGRPAYTEDIYSEPIQLIPRGQIWLRVAPIEDEDANTSFLQDFTQC